MRGSSIRSSSRVGALEVGVGVGVGTSSRITRQEEEEGCIEADHEGRQ